MAASPLIVGFVKLLLEVFPRPLRVRHKHVPSVRFEARQIGIVHLVDAVA